MSKGAPSFEWCPDIVENDTQQSSRYASILQCHYAQYQGLRFLLPVGRTPSFTNKQYTRVEVFARVKDTSILQPSMMYPKKFGNIATSHAQLSSDRRRKTFMAVINHEAAVKNHFLFFIVIVSD